MKTKLSFVLFFAIAVALGFAALRLHPASAPVRLADCDEPPADITEVQE